MDNYPYKVYDRTGRLVMQGLETVRYEPNTERDLLESGHTIKLHGKRITKKDVQNRV